MSTGFPEGGPELDLVNLTKNVRGFRKSHRYSDLARKILASDC